MRQKVIIILCRQTRIVHTFSTSQWTWAMLQNHAYVLLLWQTRALSNREEDRKPESKVNWTNYWPHIIIIFSYMYSVSVEQEKAVCITYVWIQQEGLAILHVCLDVGQSSISVIKSTCLPLIINFSNDQVWTWCKMWVGFFAFIKFDLSSPRLTTRLNKPWKWSDFYYLTKLSR